MGRCFLDGNRLTMKQIRERRKQLLLAYEMGLNNASKWHFERFIENQAGEKK